MEVVHGHALTRHVLDGRHLHPAVVKGHVADSEVVRHDHDDIRRALRGARQGGEGKQGGEAKGTKVWMDTHGMG